MASWWSRHPRTLRALALGAIGWGVVYLAWRLGWTGAGAQPVTYWLLVTAELFGLVSLALYAWLAWKPTRSRRPPVTTARTVDVYVCTYDEPVEVVHATLAGCNALHRPHRTYLLDDGRRPEMRRLAGHLGVDYLTRADNAHAKAGNINAALPRTDGELIAILDADHVPLPDFLDATLGYFDDPRLALVQTPHDFYNRDSVQHTREWRHEQTLFYDVIAPGKDRSGSMFWCGSATVLRRRALEDVGGVLTDTVAEDFHTTIAMHARGWRTRYHHETLVQGLAPHDLAGFLLQRDRWARGNLRVFRTAENPITCRGLRPAQRLNYLASLLHYFAGAQRLALLAVLITTLLTGLLPMHASLLGLLCLWLPWSVLAFCTTVAAARGTLGAGDSTRYGLLTAGIYTRAVLSLVTGRKKGFVVTPKEGIDPGGLAVLRTLPFLGAFAALLALAWSLRVLSTIGLPVLPELHGLALLATLVIGTYELVFLALTIVPLVRRRQLRSQYRFRIDLTASVGDHLVRVVDLNPHGFGLVADRSLRVEENLTLRVELPRPDGSVVRLHVHAAVVRQTLESAHGQRLGCRIVDVDPATYDALVDYCFVVQPFRALRGTDEAPLEPPVDAWPRAEPLPPDPGAGVAAAARDAALAPQPGGREPRRPVARR